MSKFGLESFPLEPRAQAERDTKLESLQQWVEQEALEAVSEDKDEWRTYPWYAPRVIWRYLERQTQDNNPSAWSIDNYDGAPTWIEMQTLPEEKHRRDAEPTTAQRREFRAKLIQLEIETEEMTETTTETTKRQAEWKLIKNRM